MGPAGNISDSRKKEKSLHLNFFLSSFFFYRHIVCVTVGQTSVLGHGTQESHTLNLREEHHRREKNTIDEFVINTYNTTTNISCGGQSQASPHSPHKPLLVVSHSTCSLRSSSPHAHSFVLGTAVINNNIKQAVLSAPPWVGSRCA